MPVSYRGVNLIVLFDLFGSFPSLVLVFFAVSLQVELQLLCWRQCNLGSNLMQKNQEQVTLTCNLQEKCPWCRQCTTKLILGSTALGDQLRAIFSANWL